MSGVSGKNINFGDKKIKKINLFKNKNVINIDDIDFNKILVSEEDPFGTKNPLNTLLDTAITMLLDHFAYNFHK